MIGNLYISFLYIYIYETDKIPNHPIPSDEGILHCGNAGNCNNFIVKVFLWIFHPRLLHVEILSSLLDSQMYHPLHSYHSYNCNDNNN